MAAVLAPVYTIAELTRELRQAEVLSDVRQYEYDPVANKGIETPIPFSIVIAQDCDLLQDYNARTDGKASALNTILLLEVEFATVAQEKLRKNGLGSKDWRIISANQSERYHFLQAIDPRYDLAGDGIPPLLIDFRRYFTMRAGELERQVNEGGNAKRRSRLEMPYREHLQARAAFYLQRVGLPTPHES